MGKSMRNRIWIKGLFFILRYLKNLIIYLMKKKLIIIDDHRIIRDGLKAIFKKNKNFLVVADFDNEEDLFNFLASGPCDLILMDIHLNSANGIDLTRRVKKEYPKVKVIM